MVEYIKHKRRRRMLLHMGYLYVKTRVTKQPWGSIQVWRCTSKGNRGCPGRVKAVRRGRRLDLQEVQDHSHPPNDGEVIAAKLKADAKRDAKTYPTLPIMSIVTQMYKMAPQSAMPFLPEEASMQRCLLRVRRKLNAPEITGLASLPEGENVDESEPSSGENSEDEQMRPSQEGAFHASSEIDGSRDASSCQPVEAEEQPGPSRRRSADRATGKETTPEDPAPAAASPTRQSARQAARRAARPKAPIAVDERLPPSRRSRKQDANTTDAPSEAGGAEQQMASTDNEIEAEEASCQEEASNNPFEFDDVYEEEAAEPSRSKRNRDQSRNSEPESYPDDMSDELQALRQDLKHRRARIVMNSTPRPDPDHPVWRFFGDPVYRDRRITDVVGCRWCLYVQQYEDAVNKPTELVPHLTKRHRVRWYRFIGLYRNPREDNEEEGDDDEDRHQRYHDPRKPAGRVLKKEAPYQASQKAMARTEHRWQMEKERARREGYTAQRGRRRMLVEEEDEEWPPVQGKENRPLRQKYRRFRVRRDDGPTGSRPAGVVKRVFEENLPLSEESDSQPTHRRRRRQMELLGVVKSRHNRPILKRRRHPPEQRAPFLGFERLNYAIEDFGTTEPLFGYMLENKERGSKEARDPRFPPILLPPSSADLPLRNKDLVPALSVYEVFRRFYRQLGLSLFRFEDFLQSLITPDVTSLISQIHMVCLRALIRYHEPVLLAAAPDTKPAVDASMGCLNEATWPEILRQHTAACYPDAEGMRLMIERGDYPFVSEKERLNVLCFLADRLMRTRLVMDTIAGKRLGNEEICRRCSDTGDLLCCDGCPAVYHLKCAEPRLYAVPMGNWFCHVCRQDFCEGVSDCFTEEERAGIIRKAEPLGFDREGSCYYFVVRRIVVEKRSGDIRYYSTLPQLARLLSTLDHEDLEVELCDALAARLDDVISQMELTERLTRRLAVSGDADTWIAADNAMVMKDLKKGGIDETNELQKKVLAAFEALQKDLAAEDAGGRRGDKHDRGDVEFVLGMEGTEYVNVHANDYLARDIPARLWAKDKQLYLQRWFFHDQIDEDERVRPTVAPNMTSLSEQASATLARLVADVPKTFIHKDWTGVREDMFGDSPGAMAGTLLKFEANLRPSLFQGIWKEGLGPIFWQLPWGEPRIPVVNNNLEVRVVNERQLVTIKNVKGRPRHKVWMDDRMELYRLDNQYSGWVWMVVSRKTNLADGVVGPDIDWRCDRDSEITDILASVGPEYVFSEEEKTPLDESPEERRRAACQSIPPRAGRTELIRRLQLWKHNEVINVTQGLLRHSVYTKGAKASRFYDRLLVLRMDEQRAGLHPPDGETAGSVRLTTKLRPKHEQMPRGGFLSVKPQPEQFRRLGIRSMLQLPNWQIQALARKAGNSEKIIGFNLDAPGNRSAWPYHAGRPTIQKAWRYLASTCTSYYTVNFLARFMHACISWSELNKDPAVARQYSIIQPEGLVDREVLKHELLNPSGLRALYYTRSICIPFTVSSNMNRPGGNMARLGYDPAAVEYTWLDEDDLLLPEVVSYWRRQTTDAAKKPAPKHAQGEHSDPPTVTLANGQVMYLRRVARADGGQGPEDFRLTNYQVQQALRRAILSVQDEDSLKQLLDVERWQVEIHGRLEEDDDEVVSRPLIGSRSISVRGGRLTEDESDLFSQTPMTLSNTTGLEDTFDAPAPPLLAAAATASRRGVVTGLEPNEPTPKVVGLRIEEERARPLGREVVETVVGPGETLEASADSDFWEDEDYVRSLLGERREASHEARAELPTPVTGGSEMGKPGTRTRARHLRQPLPSFQKTSNLGGPLPLPPTATPGDVKTMGTVRSILSDLVTKVVENEEFEKMLERKKRQRKLDYQRRKFKRQSDLALEMYADVVKKELIKRRYVMVQDLMHQVEQELDTVRPLELETDFGGAAMPSVPDYVGGEVQIEGYEPPLHRRRLEDLRARQTRPKKPPAPRPRKSRPSTSQQQQQQPQQEVETITTLTIDESRMRCGTCNLPYDPTKFYIGCDLCSRFYHGSCVGVTEKQSKRMQQWVCDSCAPLQQQAEQELYCICRTPYDEAQFYICCDQCQEWFHGACVGVSEAEGAILAQYVCAACDTLTRPNPNTMPLSDEHVDRLKDILVDILVHPMAWPFKGPVDETEFPNYSVIITDHIDLTTVQERLGKGAYKTLQDVINDVTLIFDNAYTYHGRDAPVSHCADVLDKAFTEQIRLFRETVLQ